MNDFDSTILDFMREYPLTALIMRTTGEYDPAKGSITPLVKNVPVEAILLDYTLQSNGLGTGLGTDIKAGDKQLFVRPPHKSKPGSAPLEIDPTTDTAKVGALVYEIVRVKEINPSGVDAILYELQLRR